MEKHPSADIKSRDDKYEIVLGMKELAGRGMAAEVVEEVTALDPNFFLQNHILLFQLKQVNMVPLSILTFIKYMLRVLFLFFLSNLSLNFLMTVNVQ